MLTDEQLRVRDEIAFQLSVDHVTFDVAVATINLAQTIVTDLPAGPWLLHDYDLRDKDHNTLIETTIDVDGLPVMRADTMSREACEFIESAPVILPTLLILFRELAAGYAHLAGIETEEGTLRVVPPPTEASKVARIITFPGTHRGVDGDESGGSGGA